MELIVKEKQISFKRLEEEIFCCACEAAREITTDILESFDRKLQKDRDRKAYRDKGTRLTSIKTVYGEVPYRRHVYQTSLEDGRKAFIYLLDREMGMDKIGLVSSNLAEKIAEAVTESPYRVSAEQISGTCGQSISAQGAWNVMQRLGERIGKEEEREVSRMKEGKSEGKRGLPILFEEKDGIWLNMQGEHHKRTKKQELKVLTLYEGWDEQKEKEGRSTLAGKHILAGMEGGREFHEKAEAQIRKYYDADEIMQRVLNGDGGSWIRDPYDPEVIFQLDRYHIYQEIQRRIKERDVQKDLRELLEEGKTEELLERILTYEDEGGEEEKGKRFTEAGKLYEYLSNNKEGLQPWQKQMGSVPEAPRGLLYKGMGVQENQNCTVITLRMKHRRMRWSEKGADNLAKVLYRKENGELSETIRRLTDGEISAGTIRETTEVLSAAKAPKREGRGERYADLIRGHVPLLDAIRTGAREVFIQTFCQ